MIEVFEQESSGKYESWLMSFNPRRWLHPFWRDLEAVSGKACIPANHAPVERVGDLPCCLVTKTLGTR
jgi:hypothetical protein